MSALTAVEGDEDGDGVVDSKHVTKSVSFWGALITAVPLVVQLTGVHVSAEEATAAVTQAHAAADAVQHAWIAAIALIGFIQMVIGRYTATQPLHVVTPYKVEAATGKKIPTTVIVPPDVATAMSRTAPATTPPANMGG